VNRNGVLFGGLALVSAAMLAGIIISSWTAFGGGDMGSMHGGANTSGDAVTIGAMANTVDIRDFAFATGNLRVPVGATVTWTNFDSAPHSATAKDGSWDTGNLGRGDGKSLTFGKPGDYDYYCRVHPSMKARLQVR
jgi:plastocyanin